MAVPGWKVQYTFLSFDERPRRLPTARTAPAAGSAPVQDVVLPTVLERPAQPAPPSRESSLAPELTTPAARREPRPAEKSGSSPLLAAAPPPLARLSTEENWQPRQPAPLARMQTEERWQQRPPLVPAAAFAPPMLAPPMPQMAPAMAPVWGPNGLLTYVPMMMPVLGAPQLPAAPPAAAEPEAEEDAGYLDYCAGAAAPAERTTIMIRNIPCKYTREGLVDFLFSVGLRGAFDFLYLPFDLKNGANSGYAFVNLRDTSKADLLFACSGRALPGTNSNKRLLVQWAEQDQGLAANVSRWQNNPIRHADEAYQPALYDEKGNRSQLPPPTQRPKRLRLRLAPPRRGQA